MLFKNQCVNVLVKFPQKAVLISSIDPSSDQDLISILHDQISFKMADLTLKMTTNRHHLGPISILENPILIHPSSNQDLISTLHDQISFKMTDPTLKMTPNRHLLGPISILENPILIQ